MTIQKEDWDKPIRPPFIQKVLAFMLEALPAYLHLLLTRRWIKIEVIQEEESVGVLNSLSIKITTKTPSLYSVKYSLKVFSSYHREMIPSILLGEAFDEILQREFPRTTTILKWDIYKVVIIIPQKDLQTYTKRVYPKF